MADTPLERRRPGVWPWILGLTVLALAIWAVTEMLGRSGDAADEPMQAPAPTPGRTGGTTASAAWYLESVPHASITDGRGIS